MGKHVLVIDDTESMRRLMRVALEKAGYQVTDMASAEDLDNRLCEITPDIIVSDIMMPGEDGLSLCKRLNADPELDLPVILVSAKAFEADRHAALAAGAAGYLMKPFQPTQLVEMVRASLSTNTAVTIWGCRGSIPTPEKAGGLYGGNTSCIELSLPGNQRFIFDAGTGIRALGHKFLKQSAQSASLFLTHYHWDHMQGLPFFTPLYIPGNSFHVYGPADSSSDLVRIIEGQMGGAFFPISTSAFLSTVQFNGLREETFESQGISISTLYVVHPGRTLAYRIETGDHSIVIAPDNEIFSESVTPELNGEALRFAEFASGASLLVHDCQYSREMYAKRRGWGHSNAEFVAAVAAHAKVKRILLFHHDPDSTDEGVQSIHSEFKAALGATNVTLLSEPAREGETYVL